MQAIIAGQFVTLRWPLYKYLGTYSSLPLIHDIDNPINVVDNFILSTIYCYNTLVVTPGSEIKIYCTSPVYFNYTIKSRQLVKVILLCNL